MNFYKKLFVSLVLCVGGGWLFGLVTRNSINSWYRHLVLPPGNPPNFIFPIVWTILYVLMAVSFTLFWSSDTANKKLPSTFFALQLIFNFSWSLIFFGMQSLGLALIDLVLLWGSILATIVTFKKHTRLGACLLIPYLAWVSYAFYLNLYIWLNNH